VGCKTTTQSINRSPTVVCSNAVDDLVVVLDAHADAVEHDGDQYGSLDVPAFDEALDAAPHAARAPSCITTNISSNSSISSPAAVAAPSRQDSWCQWRI